MSITPDGAGLDEVQQLLGDLAREVRLAGRELDDQEVDRSQLCQFTFSHVFVRSPVVSSRGAGSRHPLPSSQSTRIASPDPGDMPYAGHIPSFSGGR